MLIRAAPKNKRNSNRFPFRKSSGVEIVERISGEPKPDVQIIPPRAQCAFRLEFVGGKMEEAPCMNSIDESKC